MKNNNTKKWNRIKLKRKRIEHYSGNETQVFQIHGRVVPYSQQCRQATNEAPFVTTPSPITEELARRGKYCSAGNSSFLPLRETVNICASQFSLSLSASFQEFSSPPPSRRIIIGKRRKWESFMTTAIPCSASTDKNARLFAVSSSPFERHSTT